VKIENVHEIVQAGANILVCGSGLFKGGLIQNIKALSKDATF
jgi:pentose-5-phosphate-3-epimerase